MGTMVEVFAPEDTLAPALGVVQRVFRSWDESLSRFRPESELSALNRAAGRPFAASELLFFVTARALRWAQMTDGTFDPTLLRQIELLGYRRTFAEIGTGGDVPPASCGVAAGGGWRLVELDPQRRRITLPDGVGLDLGGIAKGMAVDASLDALVSAGLGCALVNAGGDLAVRGLPPEGDSWPIGLEGVPGEVLLLRRGALATSGTRRRRWLQAGAKRHHLLDPATGFPAEHELATVSVVAASCEEADVAATTAFIRGPARGAELLAGLGFAGIFVTEAGDVTRAGSWPEGTE